MGFIHDIKISLKLGILLLAAYIALGTVGFVGYSYLQQAGKALDAMYTNQLVPLKLINENRAYINRVNTALLQLTLATDEAEKRKHKHVIDTLTDSFNANIALIEAANLDSETTTLLAELKAYMRQYRSDRAKMIEAAMQNRNAEAAALYANSVESLAAGAIEKTRNLADHAMKIAQQSNADTKAAVARATRINVGILVAAVVLLGIGGVLITGSITKPLQALVTICEELAAGDFRDKPRKLLRRDEIGKVADALASMRASVRAIVKQVHESAEQVAASSEELTASADQSAQAVTQVAGSISEVAQDAEKQLSAAEQTTAVVEKMSANIQQIAANGNKAAVDSQQAVQKAKAGSLAVEKAISQMQQIEQTVNNSAQVVSHLGERSKEIGQIVEAIAGIAAQTNLLALNAAIEAARAGEQGRGFAVVAEEVRKLAEQSRDAAKQIAVLISEIQADTDRAVAAMGKGTHEVTVGTDVVSAAGNAFQEIASLISAVAEQVQAAAAATQQLADGSEHIVAAVKQIGELSKMAAGQAQTVSAATEEQSASMEQIAASSQSLAKLAQDLHSAVNRFQV